MGQPPLWDYARFTRPGSSHHQAFWNALDEVLTDGQRARISPGGDLRGIWEAAGSEAAAPPPASSPAPTGQVDWLTPARRIVCQFEGCRLTAYPDPGTGGDPWTIGWGHTGPEVKRGTTWTQQQADDALGVDLVQARSQMLQQLPMAGRWSGTQQAAMVSFVFNVGAGALKTSALRRRLLAGEDPGTVVQQELPKWNQAGGKPLEGLTRRRAAEAGLFCSGATWAPAPTTAAPPKASNPLAVPYFWQQDNGPEGWRQCQTSSLAMCLAYLKVPGIRDDVDYLRVVQKFGDTTEQGTHRQALKSLGVRARFRQDMSANDLMAEIKGGLPVAIGVLHHGPVSAPSGGGHWIVVAGFTADAWIVNDPYGELDLVNGGWASQANGAGKGQAYSFRNLNPRWLPEGSSSGWAWVFS